MSLNYGKFEDLKTQLDQRHLRGIDRRLSITIFLNDEEHTIKFQTVSQRNIFKVLFTYKGNTVSPADLFKMAGSDFKEFHLSDKVSRINKQIAHLNLQIINERGKGYRLVEGENNGNIPLILHRTLVLEDGTEITIECSELMLNILEYIATNDGVTAREISNTLKLDKPATAQSYISKLRSQLREYNLNISLSVSHEGLKVYSLVPLEM
jgi:chromosome segregation and condensation protein ScpB